MSSGCGEWALLLELGSLGKITKARSPQATN